MIKLFKEAWSAVPYVFIDVETTGTTPGVDGVCQVAVVRFEGGQVVTEASLIDPGREIPVTAITIHGITNEMVRGAPSIGEFFARPLVVELLNGAQPGSYNAPFDRAFVPLHVWGDDWGWHWVDPLTFVRAVDRFVRGAGRHKLGAACERRGIKVAKAHDAGADAEAAGRLFFRVVEEYIAREGLAEFVGLGFLLQRQRMIEAEEWYRFTLWLASQPPREEARP